MCVVCVSPDTECVCLLRQRDLCVVCLLRHRNSMCVLFVFVETEKERVCVWYVCSM